MRINADTKIYALIGNQVTKSLSPFIHNYVFEFLKQNKVYVAHSILGENLKRSIAAFKTLGYEGINVTIPHKISVIEYLDELDISAKVIGAVNTIKIINGKLIGYNTDGIGFLNILEENDVNLLGKKVLVLGAGGAARGIAIALAGKEISQLAIRNRTYAKADLLVEELKQVTKSIVFTNASKQQTLKEFDIVINATSVGMHPYADDVPIDLEQINDDAILCDIVYKPHLTKFLELGIEKGHKVIFGIEMLIVQALLAQEIWMKSEIDKSEIKENLQKKLQLLL
ncbi:MAG: shikimate dehydrogenase [Alkaliphilus sp.]